MSAGFILYGSRARGDAREDSDVDLLIVPPTGAIERPRKFSGLSVHIYPQDWLLREARAGDLFACHIAYEGISIWNAEGFITQIRSEFRWKPNYSEERKVAVAILRLIMTADVDFGSDIRRRLFWAIRTVALTKLGDQRQIDFSLKALEGTLKVSGVAQCFRNRESLSKDCCFSLAESVLEGFDDFRDYSKDQIAAWLIARGGIAENSVFLIELEQLQDVGSLPNYI